MKIANHIDLFFSRFGILLSRSQRYVDFRSLWKHLRFNPVSPITERELGKLSHAIAVQLILQEFNVNHILDVGANEGQFRNHIRSWGYKGKIISFEPNSVIYDKLISVKDDDWLRLKIGLGAEEEDVFLNICEESSFSSIHEFEENSIVDGGTKIVSKEKIAIRRLDHLLSERFRDIDLKRTLLKVDTQGNDLNVFIGAGEHLSAIPAIIFEGINHRINKGVPNFDLAFDFLKNQGFKIRSIAPVAIKDSHLIEFDVLMIKDSNG